MYSRNLYPEHPVKHRRVDNTPFDQVQQLMNHPQPKVRPRDSASRYKHFKV